METNKEQNFRAEIVSIFPIPSLGVGKFVISAKIENNYHPAIGFYLTFSNNDIWKITGVVSSGINKDGKEFMSERHNEGLWDLV